MNVKEVTRVHLSESTFVELPWTTAMEKLLTLHNSKQWKVEVSATDATQEDHDHHHPCVVLFGDLLQTVTEEDSIYSCGGLLARVSLSAPTCCIRLSDPSSASSRYNCCGTAAS